MASTQQKGKDDSSSNKPLLIASAFLIVCIIGPLAGFYAFSGVGKVDVGGGGDRNSTVYLHTKSFALGVRNVDSAYYVVSIKLPSLEDADRLCQYMALILDAVNRYAQTQANVKSGVAGAPPPFDLSKLNKFVRTAARPTRVLRVSLLEADVGVSEFGRRRIYLNCYGGQLVTSKLTR